MEVAYIYSPIFHLFVSLSSQNPCKIKGLLFFTLLSLGLDPSPNMNMHSLVNIDFITRTKTPKSNPGFLLPWRPLCGSGFC